MDTFLANTGNYRSLIVYQKAECIYDITFYLLTHFFSKSDCNIDQMVQAARRGELCRNNSQYSNHTNSPNGLHVATSS